MAGPNAGIGGEGTPRIRGMAGSAAAIISALMSTPRYSNGSPRCPQRVEQGAVAATDVEQRRLAGAAGHDLEQAIESECLRLGGIPVHALRGGAELLQPISVVAADRLQYRADGAVGGSLIDVPDNRIRAAAWSR